MPEQGPGPGEEEAIFTPAMDDSVLGPEGRRESTNENPIELTRDELRLIGRAVRDPGAQEVRALMERRGIPYGDIVKVEVEGRVFNMVTDPRDFGTEVEEE